MSNSQKSSEVKVSIVLPTYNQSSFLLAAIHSILDQTYTNFELIIVNDGCTDETASILASIQHPQLRIIAQENQGLPSALNTGFAVAKGEYWTWTSTDNTVAPTWLEELVKALDTSPPEVGYAFSYYAVIDETAKIQFINRDQRFDLPTLLMCHAGNASFMYRAELAKKVGLYDKALCYAEDLDMWIRMAGLAPAIHVESVLYYYRQHNNSMTSQQDKVRKATTDTVNKFLSKTDGKFDIDQLYPCIQSSADPVVERWKARMRLVTLGMQATFYCPVAALIDQLQLAIAEYYDTGLVVNIVHLYAKIARWDLAHEVIALYREKDNAQIFIQLADIVLRQDVNELQKIPFVTIEENLLATNCKSELSQKQLLRNLCLYKASQKLSYETLVTELVNALEDLQDHPNIWKNIAEFRFEENEFLNNLRMYLTDLISVPQDPQVLILLAILEAVCFAYTANAETAKERLQTLSSQLPHLPVLKGALSYLNQDETLLA
jgi:glycosyltransferase involved in cell wall biosynthesis